MMEILNRLKLFFKYIQKFTIVHIFYIITFFTSGLILNIIQGSLYWSLRYINKRLYRKINYYLTYSLFSQLTFLSEHWANSDLFIYIDDKDLDKYYGKEHVLLLINHSYEIDWMLVTQFFESFGTLGNFKAFAKKSSQYFPPLGWSWKFSDYILLNRSIEKDKDHILVQMNELGDYPDPVVISLYAEGTRLTAEKLKASQEFAKERGLPILKHHLLPRPRGFITSLQGMHKKIKVIYDTQLAFKKDAKTPPKIMNILSGQPVQAHLYMSRIPIDSIPEDEEGATKWLYNHYERKDQMQESFHNTGSFFTESGIKPIPGRKLEKRIYSLINTVLWNIVILIPMIMYMIIWFIKGQYLYFSIICGIIGIFYLIMKYIVSMSQVNKGSSYGAAKKIS